VVGRQQLEDTRQEQCEAGGRSERCEFEMMDRIHWTDPGQNM
jgi:hypothetical protein